MEEKVECTTGAEVHKAGWALLWGGESEDSNPGCQGNCNSLHPQSLVGCGDDDIADGSGGDGDADGDDGDGDDDDDDVDDGVLAIE